MLNIFKTAYCFYVTQLLLHCKTDAQLNKLLDRIIDENKFEEFIQGDNDIKMVLEYVCQYRSFNRNLREDKPVIATKTVIIVLVKSIF